MTLYVTRAATPDCHPQFLIVDDATGKDVACIYNAGTEPETRAIADRMAAADDMLVALKNARQWAVLCPVYTEQGAARDADLAAIDAAIAKATFG